MVKTSSTTVLKFRRRREALTNYKRRLALVKSGGDRVVVRTTNSRIIGQIVAYKEVGDEVKVSVDSNKLKKMGWPSRPNRPTAYLTGMLLAQEAKHKLPEGECVLDIGLAASVKGAIPFVFAKGCTDNGLKLKGTFEIDEKLYNCTTTAKYAEKAKGNQFKAYKEAKVDAKSLPEMFIKVRDEIKKSK